MNDKYLWTFLRALIAILIAIHGWARLVLGTTPLFGEWLNSQGFAPTGLFIAWFITMFEIGATLLLLLNRFVPLICAIFSIIYVAGIVLVHAPEGWFVVGHGRNGVEYSVLLIGCLVILGIKAYSEQKFASKSGAD